MKDKRRPGKRHGGRKRHGGQSHQVKEYPVKGKCCLCGARIPTGLEVKEGRASGKCEEVETWYYCPSCWDDCRRLEEGGVELTDERETGEERWKLW